MNNPCHYEDSGVVSIRLYPALLNWLIIDVPCNSNSYQYYCANK